MNGHLPECPSSSPDPLAADCCCSRLRACEQRVREEDQRSLIKYGVQMFMRGKQYGRPMGYAAGLDAAREAIAALDIGRDVRFSVDVRADALAAIDALREKP